MRHRDEDVGMLPKLYDIFNGEVFFKEFLISTFDFLGNNIFSAVYKKIDLNTFEYNLIGTTKEMWSFQS